MIILDTSAALAIAEGHKALNQLAANMANTPGDVMWVPALCLAEAVAASEEVGRAVLSLSSVAVDNLDTVAAMTVGTLVRDGFGGLDTCHALYCASPRPQFTGMSILLTAHEDRYPPGIVTVDIDSPGMLGHH
ncbi:hypothetical protein [Streptomyces sp. WAC01280]|uniref:hypothetical protein n=1 Tax=Streptomyces sp. WAC01280 TaxID=2487424 RepID=UPI000F7B0601|nr:hypothetical protein [Streptomyces sp. WAC01280]RSS51276.1 hypothetical protein EF909_33780 [Streptomyces sp. WAC01280]